MLKLKHKLQLDFPHQIFTPKKQLQLSAVINEDDDEILSEMAYQAAEDKIDLSDTADAQSLEKFWNGVEADLKKDPDWFSFEND